MWHICRDIEIVALPQDPGSAYIRCITMRFLICDLCGGYNAVAVVLLCLTFLLQQLQYVGMLRTICVHRGIIVRHLYVAC